MILPITDKFKSIYDKVLFTAPKIADILFDNQSEYIYELSKMSWEEIIYLRDQITDESAALAKESCGSIDEIMDKKLKDIRNETRTFAISNGTGYNRSNRLTIRINIIDHKMESKFYLKSAYYNILTPKVEQDDIVLSFMVHNPERIEGIDESEMDIIRVTNYLNIVTDIMEMLVKIKISDLSFESIYGISYMTQLNVPVLTRLTSMCISAIYQLTGDRTIFNTEENLLKIQQRLYSFTIFPKSFDPVNKLINKMLDLGCTRGYVDPEDDNSGFGEICVAVHNFLLEACGQKPSI
jgi:hypothetical protein